MIVAENLTKRFGPIYALENVSVEIPEGITLVIGPNGGGKSTFLKLIAGIYRPTSGKIRVFGKDPWSNKEIKKHIGFSFDPPAFPNFITGREWLQIFSYEKGNDESHVEEISKIFGINFLDMRIDKYSSGMRKLLSIAQAFIGNPKLIVLDEPFSGLDFKNIPRITRIIKEFSELGSNFVIVSHIWEPLFPIADWIVMIAGGKITLYGPAETTINKVRRIVMRAFSIERKEFRQ
ncbi:ABC transporter ATP-binding protein [Pyrococcus sp. ST04]|uniref:ABC transporter ATP-binding protein n=1 Tax=Pyrococcus sp. ST04 TaxID=1183377 RepID=UPI0002605C2E|nr:ABC transporter ATP-binding protein [Pyrococcus sp. ST04]AFK22354.1 putative multidrug ABC transporter ATPase [Pyrococcus sp. ST04]